MRVLVNATTCIVGGGVQVASAFVRQALRWEGELEFHFALSPEVAGNLHDCGEQNDGRVSIITPTAARLVRGAGWRKRLLEVNYESLLNNPTTELDRLVSFAGLAECDQWRDRAIARLKPPRRRQYTLKLPAAMGEQFNALQERFGFAGRATCELANLAHQPDKPAGVDLEQSK